jgi:hypothetical protein
MPGPLPSCRVLPLPDHQFAFEISGREVTRWCFPPHAPRPYFFPVTGPSGLSLTRMGHPGAPNHDHHRSLWLAHNDLLGQDFWSEGKSPRIVQSQWYAIDDTDDYARLAVELLWLDGHDPRPLLKQDLFITVRPAPAAVATPSRSGQQDWTLELQCDFRCDAEGMAFRKSNFGVLGLRVAKSLSVVFGGGAIVGSDGNTGEVALFGQPNRWIDYSGPIAQAAPAPAPAPAPVNAAHPGETSPVLEGLTLIDHRANPGHPARWHVREDGWIGPSLSREHDVPVVPGETLRLRYLLLVHSGAADPQQATRIADAFDARPALRIQKATRAHHQWSIESMH